MIIGAIEMAAVKEQILQIINSLPDDITVDDVIAELYFKLQVDAGLTELDEGKGVSHKKVEERMSKWLRK
jgi:predicted transcriptional regulator